MYMGRFLAAIRTNFSFEINFKTHLVRKTCLLFLSGVSRELLSCPTAYISIVFLLKFHFLWALYLGSSKFSLSLESAFLNFFSMCFLLDNWKKIYNFFILTFDTMEMCFKNHHSYQDTFSTKILSVGFVHFSVPSWWTESEDVPKYCCIISSSYISHKLVEIFLWSGLIDA